MDAAVTILAVQCASIGLRLRSDSHGGGADGLDNLARRGVDGVVGPADLLRAAPSVPIEDAACIAAPGGARECLRAFMSVHFVGFIDRCSSLLFARGRTDHLCGSKGCDSDVSTATSGAKVSIVAGPVGVRSH